MDAVAVYQVERVVKQDGGRPQPEADDNERRQAVHQGLGLDLAPPSTMTPGLDDDTDPHDERQHQGFDTAQGGGAGEKAHDRQQHGPATFAPTQEHENRTYE